MSEHVKQSNWLIIFAVGIFGLLLVIGDTFFQVRETEKGLVFLFEQLRTVHNTPGLKFKIPFVERITIYDNRLQGHQLSSLEVTGGDQQKINISLYARFRIQDPVLFYKTVTTTAFFIERLTSIAESSMREVIGNYSHTALLSGEREALMNEIQNKVHKNCLNFGVSVEDVRIVEAELPMANQDAVFKRMRSDRQRIAKKLRAEGEESAWKIRAEADKQKKVLLAEAAKQGDILRGEGIAKSNEIYSDAVKDDPEFFEFMRSMEAYKTSLKGENTTLMIRPDTKFFKYFGARSR